MYDITVFVEEKQITGKTFMRLNEGDLEGYVFFFPVFLLYLFFVSFLRYGLFLIIGFDIKVRTTNSPPHPPPLRLPLPGTKRPTRPDMGVRLRP
jgi:hypothetical protein